MERALMDKLHAFVLSIEKKLLAGESDGNFWRKFNSWRWFQCYQP